MISKLSRPTVAYFGADYEQWHVLWRTLLRTALRSSNQQQMGAFAKRKANSRKSQVPFAIIFTHGFVGLYFAVTVGLASFNGLSVELSLMLAMSMIVVLLAMAILMVCQTTFLNEQDFNVLAHLPITSQTLFVTKLTVLVFFAGTLTLLMAVPLIIVMSFLGGLKGTIGLILALTCQVLFLVFGVVNLFVVLARWVSPNRLKTLFIIVQMIATFVIFAGFIAITSQLEYLQMTRLAEPNDLVWLLFAPSYWFTSIFVVIENGGTYLNWIGAFLAIVTVYPLFQLAKSKISRSFESDFAQVFATKKTAKSSTGVSKNVSLGSRSRPFSNELQVMWLLLRSHFKHDSSVKLPVFSIMPLTFFYLALPYLQGREYDNPFVPVSELSFVDGMLVNLGVLLLPVTIMQACSSSESFRAAWIFFSSPVKPGLLTHHLSVCIFLIVVLPFLAILMIALAWIYGNFVHALLHMITMAMLVNLVLELLCLTQKTLPFSGEKKGLRKSSSLFLQVFFVGILAATITPLLVKFGYVSTVSLLWTYGILLVLNVLLHVASRARSLHLSRAMEFLG